MLLSNIVILYKRSSNETPKQRCARTLEMYKIKWQAPFTIPIIAPWLRRPHVPSKENRERDLWALQVWLLQCEYLVTSQSLGA